MNNVITKKEWLKIFPEAREYLEEDLILQQKKLNLQAEIYSNQLDINKSIKTKDEKDFADLTADIFFGEDIRETEKRIRDIKQYLDQPKTKGMITDADIESARSYPFDQLIETKRGFAKCPFHNENTPSFYINKKKNYGKCFGCGWFGDTIQFVMDTENCDFIQAVKILK